MVVNWVYKELKNERAGGKSLVKYILFRQNSIVLLTAYVAPASPNKPTVLLVDKMVRSANIIDVAIPHDCNIERKYM